MWEEVNIGDKALRIRKQRSLLADSIISKIGLKDGSIGKHDIIKADGEIYDRDLKKIKLDKGSKGKYNHLYKEA